MLEHISSPSLQQFLDSLPTSLALTDKANQIVWVNDSFLGVTGLSADEIIGKKVSDLEKDVAILFGEGNVFLAQTDQRDAHWLACMATLVDGLTVHHCSDVSQLQSVIEERDTLKNKVAELNPIDSVTGMPNRRALFQSLEQQSSRSRRYGNTLSVMILRLSNFSELVRSAGKDEADKELLKISQALNDQMRWADTIGRVDANEFLFILPETEEQVTQELCEKIKEHLQSIASDNTANISLSTEFGMSQWRKGDDVGMLMQRARENLEGVATEKLAV